MAFSLTSPVFEDGGAIPKKYTRDGQNVSPPLKWKDPPKDAKSFVLVVEDPDAPRGTFRHWAVYDIPTVVTELWENATKHGMGDRLCEGVNDFGNPHYDGPEPPHGHGVHHYHFRLAALNVANLDVAKGATVADIWAAAEPHILAETELVGTYERD